MMGCVRTGSRYRWPDAKIPFVIDSDDFPNTASGQAERASIAAAIAVWEQATSIRFIARTNEPNYVTFVAGKEPDACSSTVGMKQSAGSQPIYCDPSGPGTLVHEIGHAVGLWHEQSREDRNDWITVNIENVVSDKRHNFDRHVDDGTDVGAYDYRSVMHYGPRVFAVNWRPAERLLGQSTKAAPALATARGELHLVHLGETSNAIYHSWSDGTSWLAERRIPGQLSWRSPAIAEWNGGLFMVHLGDSSNDIWCSGAPNARDWSKNDRARTQGGKVLKSKDSPALAAFNGELHMVHLGSSSNDIWHSRSTDGMLWTDTRIPAQTSKAAPALAIFKGQLHMVHLDDSTNRLWHSWTDDGRTWTPNIPIDGQLSQSPVALSEFENYLQLAHVGDESPTIWHSRFPTAEQEWLENNRRDNNETYLAPAMSVLSSVLYSAHKGRRTSRIWVTQRDTSLLAIVAPMGVRLGSSGTLSAGDIATVASIY